MVESDDEIIRSKEDLRQNTSDQLTTKQQLPKAFIDKGRLIDSTSKSNLYFLKRKLNKNWSFERRQGSGRIKNLNSEINQKIIDLVRENKFINIKEITSIPKKDFSTTSSYRTIYNILKENSYSYVSHQLAPKTDEEIKSVK